MHADTLSVRLQTAMHEVFEEEDMRQIFRWLHKFLNNPYSEDDQLVPAGKEYGSTIVPITLCAGGPEPKQLNLTTLSIAYCC